MKRVDNLFDKICSIENLRIAEKKARKGKENTYGVKMYDKNAEENLENLHKLLVSGKFRTSKYTHFVIYEPKERLISRLPYYPDRIVHHAIMNVMEPIWTKTFTTDTYSCIKNRGIRLAEIKLTNALRYYPQLTKFCLKLDIHKFYPSIQHDILKSIIRKKIKDEKLLALLDEIIDSEEGVPIGNYLSQFFANLVLTYLDHKLKEVYHLKFYYRYADDIVVLSDNKKQLWDILEVIKKELAILKLELKPNWQVFPVDKRGIDFLGFVFYHDHVVLRKSIKQNIFRHLAKIKNQIPNMTAKEKKMSIASWIGWLKYCNSEQLKKKVNELLLEEIV